MVCGHMAVRLPSKARSLHNSTYAYYTLVVARRLRSKKYRKSLITMEIDVCEPFPSASQLTWPVGKVDLIIPVYRNKALVAHCIESISDNIEEISANAPRLIVVNDSPDDYEVTNFLREEASKGVIDLLIENTTNVGFVKSVNKALEESKKRHASAILINSDTETFKGTLAELIAVANVDDLFGFVCPRSNNASIGTFPRPPHARAGKSITPSSTYDLWTDLKDMLPRYAYAPTAIGFYMLIKSVIIRNFDGLDERYGVGYEEENDLVMRGGKVGFRAVFANHAFAYHAGSASFTLTGIQLQSHKSSNLEKLNEVHPEFIPNVRSFELSAEYRSELLLKGLLKDSAGAVDIAFVLLSMSKTHNGTNEFVVNVLKRFCEVSGNRYNITLICDPETAKFHELDTLGSVRVTSALDHVYAIAFSFGQPYDLHFINVMEGIAPIVVYSMLDVISLDCASLRFSQNVTELWNYVADSANGLVFISRFSRDTFVRRFPATSASNYARLLSTQTECYSGRYKGLRTSERHVLVAGNHFAHKDSGRVGKVLANTFPSLSFLVFGEQDIYPPNVELLKSGSVNDADMIQAICDSSAIILPSFYEGFGFTLMHALAAGKPIVARDIAATREIIGTFEGLTGVYLFSDDKELERALAECLNVRNSSFSRELGDNWSTWTEHLMDFLDTLMLDRANIYPTAVKRLKRGDALRSNAIIASRAILSGLLPVEAAMEEVVVLYLRDLTELPAEQFVDCIYENILGRRADTDGRAYHIGLVDDGISRSEIVNIFLASEEFKVSKRNVRIVGLPKTMDVSEPQGIQKPAKRWFQR